MSLISPFGMVALKATLLMAMIWCTYWGLRHANPRWQVWSIRMGAIGLWLLIATAMTPAQLEIPLAHESVLHSPVVVLEGVFEETNGPESLGMRSEETRKADAEPARGSVKDMDVLGAAIATEPRIRGDAKAATSEFSWMRFALIVWGTGVVVGAIHWGSGVWRLRRLLSQARAVDSSTQELSGEVAERLGIPVPRLLASDAVSSPAVVGVVSPVVLVPSATRYQLHGEELESALAHEFAHVNGRDLKWDAFVRVTCLFFWPHPLVWRVIGCHRTACEKVSDLTAAEVVQDRGMYASSLVSIASRVSTPSALGMSMARSPMVLSRLKTLSSDIRATRLGRTGLAAACAVVVLTVVLGTTALVAIQQVIAQTDAPNRKEERQVFSGTVLSTDGTPAVGAIVRLNMLTKYDDSRFVETDDEGKFRFECTEEKPIDPARSIVVLSGDRLEVAYLSATEFLSQKDDGAAGDYEASPVVQLQTAMRTKVKVVDKEGEPLASANVVARLLREGASRVIEDGSTFTDCQGTDDNGEVDLLIPTSEGGRTILAWKDFEGVDFQSWKGGDTSANSDGEIANGPRDGGNVRLELAGASPLTMRCTDSSRLPIANARPSFLYFENEEKSKLGLVHFQQFFDEVTDSAGELKLNWFPCWVTQKTPVLTMASGYVSSMTDYEPSTGLDVLDVQMTASVPVRGRVTRLDGQPVLAATAFVNEFEIRELGAMQFARTDRDGRFEIEALPNQDYTLTVHEPNGVVQTQSGTTRPGAEGAEEHYIVLPPSTRVYGRVLNKLNRAPVRAMIRVERRTGDPQLSAARDGDFELVRQFRTGELGVYSCRLVEGRYRISVLDQSSRDELGQGSQLAESIEIQVEGQERIRINFPVDLSDAMRR